MEEDGSFEDGVWVGYVVQGGRECIANCFFLTLFIDSDYGGVRWLMAEGCDNSDYEFCYRVSTFVASH